MQVTSEQFDKEIQHRMDRFGLNPCGEIIGQDFLCVGEDTLLLTKDKLSKIKDLENVEVDVWNGKRWSTVTPIKTGANRKLLRVSFSDGTYLDTTENHRFLVRNRFQSKYSTVEAQNLKTFNKYQIHTKPFTIDYQEGVDVDSKLAYTMGVMVGDGTASFSKKSQPDKLILALVLHGEKKSLPVLGNKSVEKQREGYSDTCVEVTGLSDLNAALIHSLKNSETGFELIADWDKKSLLNFIAGLADTDGSNTSSSGIRIYIAKYERVQRLQLLLTKCGVKSSICLMSKKGSVTNMGTRTDDMYYLQITDCKEIPCFRLNVNKGQKAPKKGKWQIVKSVEELPGLHDTYCFEESEFNEAVFGNSLTKQCNLNEVNTNMLDPHNLLQQETAFKAASLSVATLLHHNFSEISDRLQYSRELDPIVGVAPTGLFDFFVNAFGVNWLLWWQAGRPDKWCIPRETYNSKIFPISKLFPELDDHDAWEDDSKEGLLYKLFEQAFLEKWKSIVEITVREYCDRNNLRRPNRCTTVQPSGTKSLLTGASPGVHVPKGQRFLRRITFSRNDAVAMACIDYGYNVVPSQSCKDENGVLLNDPYDDRVDEWLVEIPVATPWADLADEAGVDISKFSIVAQFDFLMQVQNHYVGHNTSCTLEIKESEIETLAHLVYENIQNNGGYMSAAVLARFDSNETFPRLPFEPISKEVYEREMAEVLKRRSPKSFHDLMSLYDSGWNQFEGPSGCDSDKCLMPERK